THPAAARSITPPWATPRGVLARWGRLLLLGALLGPQSLADSAAHTFPLAAQSLHLLFPAEPAYYTCEDLPFVCKFLLSRIILSDSCFDNPFPLFSGIYGLYGRPSVGCGPLHHP